MRYLFLTFVATGLAVAGTAAFGANPGPQATPGNNQQQVGGNGQQGGQGNGAQVRARRGFCGGHGGQGYCGAGRGMGRGLRQGPQDGTGPRRDGSCLNR